MLLELGTPGRFTRTILGRLDDSIWGRTPQHPESWTSAMAEWRGEIHDVAFSWQELRSPPISFATDELEAPKVEHHRKHHKAPRMVRGGYWAIDNLNRPLFSYILD